MLSPISQDTTLAYSMPFAEAPSFLAASQEIPVSKDASQIRYTDDGSIAEEKKWIMKAVKSPSGDSYNLRRWAQNAWVDFVDLLKVCCREYIENLFSNVLIECRDLRYHHHDSWLSLDASDIRRFVPVHEAIRIQLLAGGYSPDFLILCIPFWLDCYDPPRRASEHGFTI